MHHRPPSDQGDPEAVTGTCSSNARYVGTTSAGGNAQESTSRASVASARDRVSAGRAGSYLRDPEAFTAAYRRFAPAARTAALSVLRDEAAAEDVVQDVFCELWMRPEAYRPERGSLGTFVYLLGRSRALDRLRSSAAAAAALHRDALEARARPSAVEPTSEEVIRRVSAREMLSDLDRLPDGQRAAVLLHHVGGLSDGELARAMQVPLGTAKSRIRLGTRRARDAMQQRLAA
ncbi:MAG TPA: sigma-70 family RNA polymerase sigma factor [Solirubrobacteraceae bacterium]|nr:sigma-70 family RNA polymerase sigma factor [Solirubrobacteraceae bacterium]